MNRHFIQNRSSLFLTASIVGLAVLFGRFQRVRADDFRVESKVYEGKATKPSSESLTLFVSNGSSDTSDKWHEFAYDFLSSPNEITVFDTVGQRTQRKDESGVLNVAIGRETHITLLDPVRQVRTELNEPQLEAFAERLRSRAARQSNPLLKFAAHPKFDESYDDESRCMRFTSPWITYYVRLARDVDTSLGAPYFQFCDYSARLNSMLHPGALPPFPRLAVDAALDPYGVHVLPRDERPKGVDQHAGIPEQVEVRISDPKGGKPTVLRSEHHFSTQLTAADRQRIDEANGQLKAFEQVSWEEYVRPIQQAKR
jgi:hypothetical protein